MYGTARYGYAEYGWWPPDRASSTGDTAVAGSDGETTVTGTDGTTETTDG